MQRDVAVYELHVAGLEIHRVGEIRLAPEMIEALQRLAVIGRELRHAFDALRRLDSVPVPAAKEPLAHCIEDGLCVGRRFISRLLTLTAEVYGPMKEIDEVRILGGHPAVSRERAADDAHAARGRLVVACER